jgi:hypothetical protein
VVAVVGQFPMEINNAIFTASGDLADRGCLRSARTWTRGRLG